jgi:DNA-directed RNA polymerase subunit H (RpoH/RPB5)
MMPFILLIFGLVLGVYLIEYIPDIFRLMTWGIGKISKFKKIQSTFKTLEKLIKRRTEIEKKILEKYGITKEELPTFLKTFKTEEERTAGLEKEIEVIKKEVELLSKVLRG